MNQTVTACEIGGSRIPALRTPAGACDCHMHFFPADIPASPDGPPPPFPFTVPMYERIRQRLGLERTIVVQPSAYQADNTMVVETVRALGAGARGVGVVPESTTEIEIDRLQRSGIVGQRIHHLPGGVVTFDTMEKVMARVHPFGWHANLQSPGEELIAYEAKIRQLPGRFVIDHVGRLADAASPALDVMLRLLDTGRCWIKLSAPYECSRSGPPDYADVSEVARRLVAHAPERMLWGSNCPFPATSPEGKPDFADLLDLLLAWAPDEAVRQKILVSNPVELYGF